MDTAPNLQNTKHYGLQWKNEQNKEKKAIENAMPPSNVSGTFYHTYLYPSFSLARSLAYSLSLLHIFFVFIFLYYTMHSSEIN